MARAEADPDVPRHSRKIGRKRWKLEVQWRSALGGLVDPNAWGWGQSYETERTAVAAYEAYTRKRWYRGVRLIDPEGNVHSRWRRTEGHDG